MMKKGLLSAVYTIIMPYLIFACVYFLLSKQDEVTGAVFALFVVIIILISMMGIAACVVCNIVSLAALTEVGSARRNLIIKLCHIPAHLVVAAIVSGFMNPFLLLLSWIPMMVGGAFLTLSGAANICACIKLAKNSKCSLKKAILLCVLGFVPVGDIVGAAVQIRTSKV